MSSSTVFYALGDFLQWTFIPLQANVIGNIFNYSLIVLGFVGLFYWLNLQKKFNQQAKDNADQIK
jgi:hypothetical protein